MNASSAVAPTRARGLALVAAAALLWSTGGLLAHLLDGVGTWTVVFWRALFAGLFLLAFLALRDRGAAPALFRSMGRPGVIVAVCFAVASTCLVVALSLTTVAHTLIIMSTAPLLAAVLARPVLGETVRGRTWLAMAVALAGVAIMASDRGGEASLVGDLVAFVIAVMLALATVTIRRHSEVRMMPAACLGAFLAAAVALPLAEPMTVAGGDWGLLAVFGALQFGAGLALFVTGARLAPAAEVSLMAVLEPILGPLWVWLFLAVHPGVAGLVGGATVLGALVAHTVSDLRPRRSPAPE